MPLKVAVVGAGYLGRHHARIYSQLDEVELAGVVDCDAAKANEVAARYGSTAYTDYRDILDNVDAVSIVVPTTNHFDVALECVRAGKDIFVEKPIAANVPQADELIAAARKTDRVLQVGHLERYNPGISLLSKMIDRPILIEAVRLSPFLNRGCDVDVTLDLMIHDIDIVLSFIAAPVKRISAFGLSLVTEKIDEARAWIEFDNGSLACLTASRVSKEKQRTLTVFQRDTVIGLNYQTGVVERYSPADPLNREIATPEYREPLKEELKDFVQCAVRRENPRVSGVEGRNALRLALEIGSLMERSA